MTTFFSSFLSVIYESIILIIHLTNYSLWLILPNYHLVFRKNSAWWGLFSTIIFNNADLLCEWIFQKKLFSLVYLGPRPFIICSCHNSDNSYRRLSSTFRLSTNLSSITAHLSFNSRGGINFFYFSQLRRALTKAFSQKLTSQLRFGN